MKLKLLSVKDMDSKSAVELETYVNEMKATASELSHLISTGKEKTTHQLGQIRKSIARAKTVAKMKEEEK